MSEGIISSLDEGQPFSNEPVDQNLLSLIFIFEVL